MPRPNHQLLVCVIGTDGSGKTTLCSRLAGEYASERVTQIWLGAESMLMSPLRGLFRLLLRHKGEGNTNTIDYKKELVEKQFMARRLRWLQPLYLFLVFADYLIQYHFKRFRARHSEILLLDRYFFDVCVNLAITLGWTEDELSGFLQRHFHHFGFPRVRCFVRVPPDISMQRKDDIPDIGYVETRLRYYERIARDFSFEILDGTDTTEANLRRLRSLVDKGRHSLHVHYCHSNNYDLGGADFCLFRMAEAVSGKNIITTISLRLKTPILDRYRDASLPVICHAFCRPQLSRGVSGLAKLPFTGIVSLFYFLQLFRSLRPDIVHVNDLYDFVPALAARILRIPVVYHIRMIRERSWERSLFAFLLSNLAGASISVSRAVRNAYFKGTPPRRHRAEVIYDWPDDQFLGTEKNTCPEAYADYPVRVVMVGRIDSWKGQHVFVEAVRRLRSRPKEVGFFLIGGTVTGAAKSRYAETVLSTARKVGIVSLGERRDVRDLLQWADISVHASTLPDPFSGVVLESMLARATIIGADSGGVAEMIESGVHGILVPPGDATSLAAALEILLKDAGRRRKLAKAGRKRILELTEKEKLLTRILALYRDVARH